MGTRNKYSFVECLWFQYRNINLQWNQSSYSPCRWRHCWTSNPLRPFSTHQLSISLSEKQSKSPQISPFVLMDLSCSVLDIGLLQLVDRTTSFVYWLIMAIGIVRLVPHLLHCLHVPLPTWEKCNVKELDLLPVIIVDGSIGTAVQEQNATQAILYSAVFR